MSRTFVLSVSFALLAVLGATIINCGGSSSSGGGNGGGSFDVVGDWQLVFSSNVGDTAFAFGAINASGLGAFLDFSGNVVTLPKVTGAKAFSGNLTAYAVNPNFFSNGTPVETDPALGNVNSATSITGTFTSSTNPAGTFTAGPYFAIPGAPVALSGTMNGKELGFVNSLLLTFNSNGTFSGGDNFGCGLGGTIAQEKSSDVFDVTFSNVSGACTTDTRTGIAFESKTDFYNVNGGADATYFYMILLTSQLPNVRPGVIVIYH
jgi:hypothetical protein